MTDDWKAYSKYMEMLRWSPSLRQRFRNDPSHAPEPSTVLPDTPAFDAETILADIQCRWQTYPLNTKEAADEHFLTFISERLGPPFPYAIAQPYARFLRNLFDYNGIYWTDKPETRSRALLRLYAIRLRPGFLPAAEHAIEHLARVIVAQLPPGAFEERQSADITIPLYELISDPKLMPDLLAHLTAKQKFEDEYILYDTHHYLTEKLLEANGCTWDTYDPKKQSLVVAKNAKGSPAEVISTYLPNTYFAEMLTAPIPFSIPVEKFSSHGIILAPPEHGKTQLLSTFIAQFLPNTEVGLVVLDPHGDLFASLKPKVRADRLIVLDPETNPPPLNVFDFGNASEIQILQAFHYLMSALAGGLTEKQSAIVPYLLKLIRVIPNANISTLLDLVNERPKTPDGSQFIGAVNTLPELERKFFINQFLGTKMADTKDAIAWKLSAALSSEAFRAMFTTPRNTFDAFKAMQERKIVLVKGGERVLGEYGLPVFLQFIVAQFFLAALKRDALPPAERPLCVIFADEASHIFNSQTTRILTECRKYGLGFFAATQVIQQIPQDVKAAIYGATAIKIAGPVAHADAMLLAREMHTTGDDIRACKSYVRSHAEWMMYVSNITDHAVKVSVPFGALDALGEQAAPRSPFDMPAAQKQQINEFSLRDIDLPLPPAGAEPAPPKPEQPTPVKFELGDLVQVTLNGVDQFLDGTRISGVLLQGNDLFILVDGSQTAVPASAVRKLSPKPVSPDSIPGTPKPWE